MSSWPMVGASHALLSRSLLTPRPTCWDGSTDNEVMTSRPLKIATIGSFLAGLAFFAGVRWEQVTHRAMLLCTPPSEKGSSPSRADNHTVDGPACNIRRVRPA